MTTFDELPFGISWYPDEALTRTGHALDTGSGVWLIDPVDDPEAIARATALGPPAGVIQLLDRHNRDCAGLASRLGVPHLRLPDVIPDSPFSVIDVVRIPRWHEQALWWADRRALVVAEAIGTNPVYALGTRPGRDPPDAARVPTRRAAPLRARAPAGRARARVHGPAATVALRDAYERSRSDIPKLVVQAPRDGEGRRREPLGTARSRRATAHAPERRPRRARQAP